MATALKRAFIRQQKPLLYPKHRGFSAKSSQSMNIISENKKPALNFRSLLSALREQGDLIDIKEPVSPDLELAAITRRVYETHSPAPLFHNISGKDAKTGLFNILGAPVGLRKSKKERYARLALHLGLPVDSTARDILERLIKAKQGVPLPPVPVPATSSAPCKQNVLKYDEIDINKWPIPLLHADDGGKYLATYGFHVLQSPDKSWTSWSISRAMQHAQEPRSLTAPVLRGQHIEEVHRMWIEAGAEDTPWALVLGGPPAALVVAGMPLPSKVSEDGYIGAMTGAPVQVVKCESNDLFVPANAEIVIEGRINNLRRVPEGPMGEYHGYMFMDEPVPEPVFQIDCVTYQNNPVVPICVAGTAPDETQTVSGPVTSAEILAELREAEFPVDLVWLPFEAQCCWAVVSVDIKKLAKMNVSADELCRRAGNIIFSTHAGWQVPKVFLVGDDVDITDTNQVVWAMSTRYHPGVNEYLYDDVAGLPMVPYMTREKLNDPRKVLGLGGKSVTNLLLPSEFKGTRDFVASSFNAAYPYKVKQRVISNWIKYGFKEDSE
jgi:UbiD family decarboxylase